MKWALGIVAVLVGSVLLMAIVGALLPKDHVARRKARYAGSPKAVFEAIRNAAAYPSWRKDVTSVELLPDVEGRPRFRETGANGKIAFEVVEEKPNERLIIRIADDDLPFGGAWTYQIEESGTGSVLTITERGEVKNPIFRFMSRFVFGHTKTLEDYLASLGKHFGEHVTIEE